ncbi:hypothetical protein AADEFJLK_01057 [Methylovulum psychrotolerans]|uniref:Uncharacterized protein n=1 Tax=Methylovulum psychrotolerans TaxID=1704499 RepID=A0A2S5CT85_9GAMM|nr:hypothetical protein AADEFJLK_01057 [Methylovulum psychrotolerans]
MAFSMLALAVCIPIYLKKAISFYQVQSFILISRRSESEYQQYIDSKNKTQFYSIILTFFSALCGVIGNFIYQLIIELIKTMPSG